MEISRKPSYYNQISDDGEDYGDEEEEENENAYKYVNPNASASNSQEFFRESSNRRISFSNVLVITKWQKKQLDFI